MLSCFFFNDTASTEIYTLSLHDALPICARRYACSEIHCFRSTSSRCIVAIWPAGPPKLTKPRYTQKRKASPNGGAPRSEEHTSELQSRQYLVCRLLLETKKQTLPRISAS